MKKNISYVYRIKPNKQQQEYLDKNISVCTDLYNLMIKDKKEQYEKTGKNYKPKCSDYKGILPLKEIDSGAASCVREDVDNAFSRFLKKQNCRPKAKAHHSYNTGHFSICVVNNNVRLNGDKYLRLPKIGDVRIVLHRPLKENSVIKKCTIKKRRDLKYYVSLLLEYESEMVTTSLDKNKSIGLDFSIPYFYVDNNGNSPNFPHPFRKQYKIIREMLICLHKKKKGSNNYNKLNAKIGAKLTKILNQTKDWLHKKVYELCKNYDYICVEDLDLKDIASAKRPQKFGKYITDISYGQFLEILNYKAELMGKRVIKVDKYFPSSQICNKCKYVKEDLKLSDREWNCPQCCSHNMRDENAAKNILEEGMKQI